MIIKMLLEQTNIFSDRSKRNIIMRLKASENARMLVLLSIMVIVLGFASERIIEGGGLGYDGGTYGLIAMRLPDYLEGTLSLPKDNSFYYRFFPSILCHYSLKTLGVELDTQNVIRFFQIYNGMVLIGIGILWTLLSDTLKIGRSGKWWGFLGFFGNYAVLKYAFFYPVLMDVSALFLGIAMLHAYLKRNTFVLLTAVGISFFVWPVATFIGIILWLFPYPTDNIPSVKMSRWDYFSALAAVCLLLAPQLIFTSSTLSTPKFRTALPLSAAFVSGYLYYIFCGLFPGLPSSIFASCQGIKCITRGSIITIFAIMALLLPKLSPSFPSIDWILLASNYFSGLISLSLHRPAELAVAAVLYYGPILLFIAFFYRTFMEKCRGFGPGYVLVLLFVAFQSLNPLSRQMISGLPFIILPLALSLDRVTFQSGFIKIFVAASFLTSKVWLLNNIGIDKSQLGIGNPVYWQRYTSSTGWWMTDDLYLIQGGLILIGALILAVYLAKSGKMTDERPQGATTALDH